MTVTALIYHWDWACQTRCDQEKRNGGYQENKKPRRRAVIGTGLLNGKDMVIAIC
jgi:hypothetical protein